MTISTEVKNRTKSYKNETSWGQLSLFVVVAWRYRITSIQELSKMEWSLLPQFYRISLIPLFLDLEFHSDFAAVSYQSASGVSRSEYGKVESTSQFQLFL